MTRRRRQHAAGFIITLELILIFTILVIGTLVGVIAVRNALFKLAQAKAQFEVVIGDSSDPQLLVQPVNYDLCEAPQILVKDPEFGLFALVGVRPERFVSRDRVYFTSDDCTLGGGATAYVATPNDSSLPVGYLNALQGETYAVGPPADWETPGCVFGAGGCDVGQLYRATATAATGGTTINSVWTSLNPDCYLHSGGTDPVVYSTPPMLCEDLTATLSSFAADAAGRTPYPPLLLAEPVQELSPSTDNVLDKFTPLLSVVIPPNTPVLVTPAVPEGAPLQAPPLVTGTDIEPEAPVTQPDAGPEGTPPPP
jgi:hypothetical protein